MSNITVAVRVRPLIARELHEKLPEVWKVNGVTMYPIDPVTQKSGNERYIVDQIYDDNFTTRDIYMDMAKPILDAVVNGYNGTIFAYGQTSSGKTYTMMGDSNSKGIIQFAITDIFELIENVRDRKYLLRCQYIELYNDKIFDLLNNNRECKIRESENGEPKTDAKEILIDSANMLLEVMQEGTKARKVGETKTNQKSSRSHAVFRIVMESTKFVNDEMVAQVGQLNLVDLAGSERASVTQATGARLREGAQINKSLSALGLVIKQLTEFREHVNFRDSKLTRLLEPSLGGNALTAIICAVTPAALEETHSTLAFACRAKDIKNKPILNIVENTESSLLNKFSLEIKKLSEELKKASITSQEQDELNRVLAEKVEYLEERLIYRSRLLEKKKKEARRRQTWAGTSLPIINEVAAWELSCVSDSASHQVPEEQNPLQNAAKVPDKEQPGPSSAPQDQGEDENDDSLEGDTQENRLDNTAENTDEVVEWLVDYKLSTPLSILQDRADYYEHEFKTLKELTFTENKLAKEDLENMVKELEEANQALEIEQEKRAQDCADLKQAINNLEQKIADQATNLYQLQEINQSQSNTYIVELCDQKELLENLRDQLLALHNSCGPAVVERLNDVVKNYENKIEELKNIVIGLDGPRDEPQDFQPAIRILKSICEQSEEVEQSLHELPEDAVKFFRIFKSLCDVVNELLVLTMVKHEAFLNPNKMISMKKSEEKLFKLKAVIVTKDSEIEELSDKIMEYLTQLEDAESQVKEIKEAATFFQNQSDDKDKQLTSYFLKMETLKERCLNITRMTDLKIKVLKEEVDDWKMKYEAAEKEVGIRIEEEMNFDAKCWEKDDQISDLKTKLELLQMHCEQTLRKFKFVDSDGALSVEEIRNGLYAQERHILQLQAIVGDLTRPASCVDNVEANRVRARDEEIKSLSEALHYQSIKLDEYRKILAPSEKPETRSIVYYMEKQSIDLNEVKRANEVLQKRNIFLTNDSDAKDELIKQQTNQIEQLKSETLELVNNAQNAGVNLSDEYLNKQESTEAELQLALEQKMLAWQKIGKLEIDLEQKDVLLKQIKDHFSTRTEKDELDDIFELKDNEYFKEKELKYDFMMNELNQRNDRLDQLKKTIDEKDTMIVNIMLERDDQIRNTQKVQLQYNELRVELECSIIEVIGLRCALQAETSLNKRIQELTDEIEEKDKTLEDFKHISHAKQYFECLTKEQEKKITHLEGELDKKEAVCNELSDKVKNLTNELANKNEAVQSLKSLGDNKDQVSQLQEDTVHAVQHSLAFNVTALNEKIHNLGEQLASKTECVKNLEKELRSQEEKLSDINLELKEKDKTIYFVENIVKQNDQTLKSERNRLRDLQESLNDKMNKFTLELANKKELIQSLQEELREERDEALRVKESLAINCDELSTKVKNLTLELADTEKLRQEKDEALRVKEILGVNCDELSDKVKNLTLELVDKEKLRQEKDEALRVKESLTTNCEELSDKVKNLTLELVDKEKLRQEKDEALRVKESLTTNCEELSDKVKNLTLELVDKEKLRQEKDEALRVKESLTTNCEELSDKVKNLTLELVDKEELREEKNEVVRMKESLIISCDEFMEKINNLTLELANKNAHIQNIEALVNKQEERLNTEQNINHSLKKSFINFNERMDNISVEMINKEELLKNTRAELSSKDEKIQMMQSLMNTNDSTVKSQQETVHSLQESLAKLTTFLQNRDAEAQQNHLKITNLELIISEKSGIEVVVNEQSEEIKKLQDILQQQEGMGITDLNKKVNSLIRQLAVRDDEINTFRELVGQKNVTLGYNQTLIDELRVTNDKSKEILEAKDAEIKELTTCKATFNKLQTKMNVLLNQYNTAKGVIKAREGEIESLKTEMSKIGEDYKNLEEQSLLWKAQYTHVQKENDELMMKITASHNAEQTRKGGSVHSQKQMILFRDEIERHKHKVENISLEMEDLRRRYTALIEENKVTKGALEKASDSVRRLKLGRLQMESENNRLDENLKAATIEITRRLRERDLLKRELRNSQFDASRDLQDAQTETEAVTEATGGLSSEKSLDNVALSSGETAPGEQGPQQFQSISQLQEELEHVKEKCKALKHKYIMMQKLCRMRQERIDELEK